MRCPGTLQRLVISSIIRTQSFTAYFIRVYIAYTVIPPMRSGIEIGRCPAVSGTAQVFIDGNIPKGEKSFKKNIVN